MECDPGALQRLSDALIKNSPVDVVCLARCVEQGLVEDIGPGRYRLTRKGAHLLSSARTAEA